MITDARTCALLDRHTQAQDLFGARVHAVRDDQWGAGTPCAEWTVRDLVNHLVSEQLWVPSLVRDGCMIEEVGDTFEGTCWGRTPRRPGTRRRTRRGRRSRGPVRSNVRFICRPGTLR